MRTLSRAGLGNAANLLPIVVLAWALVIGSGLAGAGALLDHDRIFAAATPEYFGYAGFAVAWLVMVVAMMLPASALELTAGSRASGRIGIAVRLTGYLIVWEFFGLGLLVADGFLHRAVDANAWLERNAYLIWASVLLLVAGGEALCAWRRHRRTMLRGTRGSFVAGAAIARDGIWTCGAIMLFMMAASVHDAAVLAVLGLVGAYQQLGRWGGIVAGVLAAAALGNALFVLFTHHVR